MSHIIMTLPIAAFLVLALVTRLPGRLWIVLLFGSPFVAASLTIAVGTAFSDLGTPPASPGEWLSYVLFAYLFILPEALYPNTVLLAALVLLAWTVSESFMGPYVARLSRRVGTLTILGLFVSVIFCVAVVFWYHTAVASLGNHNSFAYRDRPPPFTVPMSLVTGALDGAFIALYGRKGTRAPISTA